VTSIGPQWGHSKAAGAGLFRANRVMERYVTRNRAVCSLTARGDDQRWLKLWNSVFVLEHPYEQSVGPINPQKLSDPLTLKTYCPYTSWKQSYILEAVRCLP
jgi:hypothetical protein